MRLVFADSELAGAEAQGDTLRLRFAAAAVEPSAGEGGEAGYLLGLVLELRGAAWDGDLADCVGRLAQGVLTDAVSRFTRLELPFDGPGPWRAEFVPARGGRLLAEAAHASVLPRGDERFVASFAC